MREREVDKMADRNSLMRQLPGVDEMIRMFSAQEWAKAPDVIIKLAIQKEIDQTRQQILSGDTYQFSQEDLIARIKAEIEKQNKPHLQRVINGTGVVLHTNLGRAKLSAAVSRHLLEISSSYSNLEYDVESGERGSRYDHVEGLLTFLTGAESALVVNNNAAAVYLILDSIVKGKEVLVSRGELVEIGGSFRIPEIMKASGCRLVEIGTTNKTHPADYEERVNEQTGALLKVHTSNYKMIGFTEDVSLAQLRVIADGHDLPVIYDMGCGLLMDLKTSGIGEEPTVRQCLEQKADLVCFSGDKLLGGPQAGIIVGKASYINRMKKNHLLRAFRIDKLTLAALELTLRQYLSPETALEQIPTLQMITMSEECLKARGELFLYRLVQHSDRNYELVRTQGQVGGGTMPGVCLPSYAVAAAIDGVSADQLERQLRAYEPPIIGRIVKDRILLDVRTMEEDELEIAAAFFNNYHVKGDTQ